MESMVMMDNREMMNNDGIELTMGYEENSAMCRDDVRRIMISKNMPGVNAG